MVTISPLHVCLQIAHQLHASCHVLCDPRFLAPKTCLRHLFDTLTNKVTLIFLFIFLDFSYKSSVAQPILTHITFYTSFLTWRMCVRKIIIASLIHISSLIFCFLCFMIFFVCFPFLWPWNIYLMHLFLDNSISSCNLLYKLDVILAR